MVLQNARRQISKLVPLADQLNSASDNFTRELKTIEAELQKLNLGIDVVCERPLVLGEAIHEVDDSGKRAFVVCRENEYLGYGQIGSEWKLLVRRYRDYEEPDLGSILLEGTSLLKSSRELRIAAAGQVEELVALIEKGARAKLEALRMVADPLVLPPGWENRRLGQDAGTKVVHMMDGENGVALCGLDLIDDWRFFGLHNATTIDAGTTCSDCEALRGGNIPAGWENHPLGIDSAEVVHVLSKDRNRDTACGARTISTNFTWEKKRLCSKCRTFVRS